MGKSVLETMLDEQVEKYRNGEEVNPGVEVREDEDGEKYLFIPFNLRGYPAEIDGETYGQLYGFRAYYFDLDC